LLLLLFTPEKMINCHKRSSKLPHIAYNNVSLTAFSAEAAAAEQTICIPNYMTGVDMLADCWTEAQAQATTPSGIQLRKLIKEF
jgi:hypothetical protein